ncbi:MAG: phospholipase D-like domain-containing protein [Pseudomonadota bacterium]
MGTRNRIVHIIIFCSAAAMPAAGCSGDDGSGDGADAGTDVPTDSVIDDGVERLDADSCEGVTCSGHGTCIDDGGGPFCFCNEGYAGIDCGECAEGYVQDQYGECLRQCGIDCGAHGTCVVLDREDTCQCDPGYEGPRCETYTGSRLEIYSLDLWGRALDPAEAALTVQLNESSVDPVIPVMLIEPGEAGTLSIHLEAPQYHPLDLVFDYSGVNDSHAYSVADFANPHDHAVVATRGMADGNWKHSVYIGLRHKWFSPTGPPPRRGNRIAFLMDGREAWARVAGELDGAGESILMATWWWESNFELVRGAALDDIYATAEERWANTIMAKLDAAPDVFKRVIVNQFVSQDGFLEDFNVDQWLLDKGERSGDGFEFMGQVNPSEGIFEFEVESFLFSDRVKTNWPETGARTFDAEDPVQSPVPGHTVDITLPLGIEGLSVASYHQKFIVVDGLTAFVGGMNTKAVDWDTNEHHVFDPRRMPFDATVEQREAVLRRQSFSDTGPRKDMMLWLDGPIVQDVADVFKKRWDYLIEDGVRFSGNSSTFDVNRDVHAYEDGIEAQLTVTLPEPFRDNHIAETWTNAIKNAEQYIFIEDQYFRAPMFNDLIVERMLEEPELVLIVVTMAVSEWTDPGCYWTYVTDALFEEMFPDRYYLYQYRSFDYVDVGWGWDETESRFVDMDVHTKVLIVDDIFMSVGSCNHNNRGLVYEGEMNVAVVDRDFVRNARQRIFGNILSHFYSDSDDGEAIAGDFASAASWNRSVWDSWEAEGWDIDLDGGPLPDKYMPIGFLYALDFRAPGDCLFEDSISPDLTVH